MIMQRGATYRELLTLALVLIALGAGCASMPHEKHPGTLPESLPQDEYVAFDDEGQPTHVCRVQDPQSLTCKASFGVDAGASIDGPLQQDGVRVVSDSLNVTESNDAAPIEVVEGGATYQIQVQITRDHIFVNEDMVTKLVDGRVPAEEKVGGKFSLLIRPLRDALESRMPEDGEAPSYILVADQTTHYRVITEIVYTLDNAGFIADAIPSAVIGKRHEIPLHCEAPETSKNTRICHAVGPEGASDERVSTLELITVGNAQTEAPRPLLGLGHIKVRDFCSKQNIREVIVEAGPRIKYCYEKELKDNLELAGTVLTRFKIMPDGTVSNAQVTKSTMNEPKVESCIVGELASLKFQKPSGGICVINYPFVFNTTE